MDSVTIHDTLTYIVTNFRSREDSAIIADKITFRVFYSLEDSIIIDRLFIADHDFIIFVESVTINDSIRPKTIFSIKDSAKINDSITVRVFYGLSDEIIISTELTTSATFHVTTLQSTAIVHDAIESLLIKFLVENPTLIQDSISIRVFSSLTDTTLVDDQLTGKVIFRRLSEDSMLIDDMIRITAKLNTQTEDNGIIDDEISAKVFYSIEDSLIIFDSISSEVIYRRASEDGLTIGDFISTKLLRKIDDAVSIDDTISIKPNYGLFDSMITIDGNLVVKRTFQEVQPPDYVAVSDFIAKKFVTFVRKDSSLIDDNLSFKVIRILLDALSLDDGNLVVKRTFLTVEPDGASLSDHIEKKLVKIVTEDPLSIDDFITTRAVNTRRIFDSVSVDDILMAKAKYPMEDSVTFSDTLTRNTTFRREFEDSATIDDSISKFAGLSTFDFVSIDDLAAIKPKLFILDSASIDDSIMKLAKPRVEDSVLVDDSINTKYDARRRLTDSASVDDIAMAKAKYLMQDSATLRDILIRSSSFTREFDDSATIDDSISKRLFYTIEDSVSMSEILSKFTTTTTFDVVTIDDMISKRVFYRIEDAVMTSEEVQNILTRYVIYDSANVDDTLTFKVGFLRSTKGDSATTSDFISKKVMYSLSDSITISNEMSNIFPRFVRDDAITIADTLSGVVQYERAFEDSASVDDSISKKVSYRMSDSIKVFDNIILIGLIVHLDSVSINDEIFVKVSRRTSDSITIDDSISKRLFYTFLDSVSVDDPIAFKARMRLADGAKGESITTSDLVLKKTFWHIEESTSITDSISKRVFYTFSDSATIDELSAAKSKYNIADSVSTSDSLLPKTFWTVEDSTSIDDTITKRVFFTISDTTSVDDPIAFKARMRLADGAKGESITATDLLFKKTFVESEDSTSISDSITKRVFLTTSDTMTVDDPIAFKARMRLADGAKGESITTSDLFILKTFWEIEDSTSISDSITKRVFYGISDSVTIDDHTSFKASIRTMHDAVTVAESDIFVIFITVVPPDSATVDDSISFKVFISLTDGAKGDSTTVADLTSFKAFSNMYDTSSIDDSISKRILYSVTDSVTVDDHTSFKASIRSLRDAVSVDDSISKKALYSITDSLTISEPVVFSIFQTVTPPDLAFIDDFISKKVFIGLTDGAKSESTTIDDSLLLKGAILIETRNQLDELVANSSYRVSPNPFTGTGSLNVTDGGPGDNSTANDGLIKVYYVPLGLYRINQTGIPAGNTTIYNFTYTTVHLTDINATALFRVVNSTTNLSLQAPIVADIVDIDVPPGFDDLISISNLAKVRNRIQSPITEVTDMPAPIFAGVSNASAIADATAAQYSLVYQNLNLGTNAAPDVIRDAFGLTQYDPGNSTDSTFVGIFTSLQNVTFGQYIATQPLDKFNCGQEYIFTLDDSLVPNFGGMTRAEFTLASNGICPDAEDYNTFEIASKPPLGSGVPSIPGEDILLYINANYSQASNGMGVDFSNEVNIDSYKLTLITRQLPETGDINDLTVYVFKDGWTKAGVKIISKELSSNQVKIVISTDTLGQFVITGKQLPPSVDNTGVKTGFGNTGVGPSSERKSKTGGDLSGAKIHRVSYDVCNENISRILVGHDRPVPPIIQLVSPQLGLVEATLSEFQPYAQQSRDAEVSRYLYEAPLGSGDRYFSIFAVDHKANVGTAQIQVEGCQGTIFFVDDKVVLPEIFDIKYQIDNSTIRPDISEHHYIDEMTDLPVSAIVDSPLVPLNRAELRVLTLGEPEEKITVVPMNIEALHLPLDTANSTSIVSGIIPSTSIFRVFT